MKKLDFFLLGAKLKLYNERLWVLNAFTPLTSLKEPGDLPGFLYVEDGKIVTRTEEGKLVPVEGAKIGESLFAFKEEVTLTPTPEIPNLKKKTESTYGRLFVNLSLLCFPFEGQFEYINEQIDPGSLNKQMAVELTNDKISVEQTKVFFNQAYFLSSFTTIATPSASERTVGTDPAIAKKRKELLEQYKDRLDDPATISKIEQELIAMDREWIKGDVAEGFYKSSKSFNITRKKMHVIQGGETRLDSSGKMDLIDTPLSNGFKFDDMEARVNATRIGAFSRGAETALGGEAVKVISRTFQNFIIEKDDCGSKIGIPVSITEDNFKLYVGRYLVGKSSPLDEAALKGLVGKEVKLRSPMTCKVPVTGLCKICMGDVVSANPQSLSMLAVQVGSNMMYEKMGAMHGKALLVEKFEFEKRIS